MTPIRPPGSSPASAPIDVTSAVGASSSVTAGAPVGASNLSAAKPHASNGASAVIADLEASRITPDAAVKRLTEIALEGARCPAAMRPAVEARIRATLASDPLLGSLLHRMGASAPEE